MKTLIISLKVVLGLGIAAVLAGCGGGGGNGDDPYSFRSDAADRYVRIDRMGEPALATALLSSKINDPVPVDQTGKPVNPGAGNQFNNANDQRDALNRGDPINDARDFAFIFTVGPQVNALANYHYKLGPQLRSLGLTPCSSEKVTPPAGILDINIDTCVAQAAPAILPDVITYDANTAAGWPNGRGFDDPVVDRLLAAALLKISGPAAPHNIDSLVGVINPPRDDSGTLSPAAFPHLRPVQPFP